MPSTRTHDAALAAAAGVAAAAEPARAGHVPRLAGGHRDPAGQHAAAPPRPHRRPDHRDRRAAGLPDAYSPSESLTALRVDLSRQRRQVERASHWLDPDDRALLPLWWLFRGDATFCVRPGAAAGSVALESSNYPGWFLRHRGDELWVDQSDGSTAFRADGSFPVRPPLAR